MIYKIRMTVDKYRECFFPHPGPGTDAIRFMEQMQRLYNSAAENEYQAEFTLTVCEEEEENADD